MDDPTSLAIAQFCEKFICGIRLYGDKINPILLPYTRQFRLVKLAIADNWVSSEQIENFLRSALLINGHLNYRQLPSEYPDHVSSPQSLAYALRHDLLLSTKLHGIRFDHHESPEDFLKRGDNLFATVKAELFGLIRKTAEVVN